MTIYKQKDNGCKHNWDDIGSDGYKTIKWCERCGALRTLYLSSLHGPDSYIRLPDPNIPHDSSTHFDTGPR